MSRCRTDSFHVLQADQVLGPLLLVSNARRCCLISDTDLIKSHGKARSCQKDVKQERRESALGDLTPEHRMYRWR